MDTDSFIINIKTEGFYEYIAGDVEKILDTSDVNSIGHYLGGVIGLMKDKLGRKIVTKYILT